MVFKQTTYHLSTAIFIFLIIFGLYGCEKKPPLPPHISPPKFDNPVQMNGKTESYKTNREGNIDKLILKQGNQKKEIHFPPHLAKHILEIAKINTSVQIKTSKTQHGYELISVWSSDGKNRFNTKDILPPKPNPGKEIQISGTVLKWIRNPEHKIVGFIAGRKTVMLNPDESATLIPLLMKAKTVDITALERDTKDGTVNTFEFPPVRMTEIKIDSIVYKIR